MRSQDRTRRLTPSPRWILAAIGAAVIATGAMAQMVPQLSGPDGDKMQEVPADPLPKWVIDDIRRMRAYPEQPPVIPHSIDGYQLSVNANRCLSCHKREFSQDAGAPMISITHYMTREGQMLADVSPRRYFCTACHVPQADRKPLVDNTFRDMSDMGVTKAGSE